jgi:hypothetical protein
MRQRVVAAVGVPYSLAAGALRQRRITSADARTLGRELQAARGDHRQSGRLSHDTGKPAVAQTFLHHQQNRAFVAGLDVDHAIGVQPGAREGRREQVAGLHAPQYRARQARHDASHEQRCRGTMHRAQITACHFVQGTQRQAALRQWLVHGRDTER